ncbi:MAG: phosphatidate cytidylyltransferase [Armatimonadota bacterium]
MLWKRVAAALVGIPVLVLLLFLGNGEAFALAVCALSLVGLQEFYSASAKSEIRPAVPFGWAGVLMACAAAWGRTQGVSLFWLVPALTVLLMAALATQIVRPNRAPIRDLGCTVLGAVYVGLLLPHLILIRGISLTIFHSWVNWYSLGARLMLFVFLVTWAADTGAYFVGRSFGRRALCPSLSPGKTVEGFLGGLLASLVVGTAFFGPLVASVLPPFSAANTAFHGTALGVIAGILGPIGDLSKSALKRELGIKDFGGIIPGHGGVLDRFDSLMFVAPASYYYFLMLLSW